MKSQYDTWLKNPSPHYIPLLDESDLNRWTIAIVGLEGPFLGGQYFATFVAGKDFPHKAPEKLQFLTPTGVYKINSNICISVGQFHDSEKQRTDNWRPSLGMTGFAENVCSSLLCFSDLKKSGGMSIEVESEPKMKQYAQGSNAYNRQKYPELSELLREFMDANRDVAPVRRYRENARRMGGESVAKDSAPFKPPKEKYLKKRVVIPDPIGGDVPEDHGTPADLADESTKPGAKVLKPALEKKGAPEPRVAPKEAEKPARKLLSAGADDDEEQVNANDLGDEEREDNVGEFLDELLQDALLTSPKAVATAATVTIEIPDEKGAEVPVIPPAEVDRRSTATSAPTPKRALSNHSPAEAGPKSQNAPSTRPTPEPVPEKAAAEKAMPAPAKATASAPKPTAEAKTGAPKVDQRSAATPTKAAVDKYPSSGSDPSISNRSSTATTPTKAGVAAATAKAGAAAATAKAGAAAATAKLETTDNTCSADGAPDTTPVALKTTAASGVPQKLENASDTDALIASILE